jgi:hypothetical protein
MNQSVVYMSIFRKVYIYIYVDVYVVTFEGILSTYARSSILRAISRDPLSIFGTNHIC